MGDLIRAVDSSFQRLLRWVYPGGLLLVLLYIASEKDLIGWELQLSSLLIVVVFFAGATLYLFQTTVINQIISTFATLTRLEKNAIDDNARPMRGFIAIANFFDKWAREAEIRWPPHRGDIQRDDIQSFLNYRWAVYHATLITGWLTLIFFIYFELWGFIAISVIFCVGAIVEFVYLCRIKLVKQDDNATNVTA